MAHEGDPFEKIQVAIVAIIGGYFLIKFFDAFPKIDGPFSDVYWIFSFIPWVLVFLGIVILASMILEVVDF